MPNDRIERWRENLASRNVVDVINAIAQVGASSLPEAVPLLDHAGSNLDKSLWSIKIETGEKSLSLLEFLDYWKEALRKSVPQSAVIQEPKITRVFISYSTMDREKAIKLAMALENQLGISVFLDRWELGPGDRLAERLESEVSDASFLIVLLSTASVESDWVRKEIASAVEQGEHKSNISIVLVKIDDCQIPPVLADVVHVDWRKSADKERAVQAVIDLVRGEPSFEKRVSEILRRKKDNNVEVLRAKDLLVDLAPGDFFCNERNQQWLVWELFHRVLLDYPLSVIIRPRDKHTGVEFELIDRWNRTRNQLVLGWESMRAGLWQANVNLHKSETQEENNMRFLGQLGRLSFQHNPDVKNNRVVPTDLHNAESEREKLFALLDKASMQTQKELLDMMQLATGPKGWHKLDVVVGQIYTDLSLAFSPMVEAPEEESGSGILVELWDPFFGSLKSTSMFQSQLTLAWGRDVDLFSNDWEFTLGPN